MPGEAPGGLAALEQVLGWLVTLGRPLEGWLVPGELAALLAGPWRAGCTASWSLEGWLCWAGPWRAGCAGLVLGGLAALLAAPWSAGYTAGPCLSKYVKDVFI